MHSSRRTRRCQVELILQHPTLLSHTTKNTFHNIVHVRFSCSVIMYTGIVPFHKDVLHLKLTAMQVERPKRTSLERQPVKVLALLPAHRLHIHSVVRFVYATLVRHVATPSCSAQQRANCELCERCTDEFSTGRGWRRWIGDAFNNEYPDMEHRKRCFRGT